MPQRTNTFQQVVGIIQRHMARGATVEESAMITPIRGGTAREVDVVVTSVIAGHEVMVSIEACRWSRKADVTWIERMKAKHDDLPTHKLILYSGSGFTNGAMDKAKEHGIVTIGAEQLSESDLEAAVLDGLRAIWPKVVSLTPERARVWVQQSDGRVIWFKAPADLGLYLEGGREFLPDLREAALAKVESQWDEVAEQIGLRDIAETIECSFVIIWRPFTVKVDSMDLRVYAHKEDVDPPELHPIEQVVLAGRAIIEVKEVSLTHMRLGEACVAYGEVTLGGRPGLVVASNGISGQLITIRLSGAAEGAKTK